MRATERGICALREESETKRIPDLKGRMKRNLKKDERHREREGGVLDKEK